MKNNLLKSITNRYMIKSCMLLCTRFVFSARTLIVGTRFLQRVSGHKSDANITTLRGFKIGPSKLEETKL